MSENLLEQFRELATQNADHIRILNEELGETCDKVNELKDAFIRHKEDFVEVKVNVNWLMKSFWVVATAAIGSLIAGVLNLLFK